MTPPRPAALITPQLAVCAEAAYTAHTPRALEGLLPTTTETWCSLAMSRWLLRRLVKL